jgi:GNAT superfamily N-acetyltransferase
MSDIRVRRATATDAERLAAVYRSASRENRELGFPAKAGSTTESEVANWIEEDRVYVAEVGIESESRDGTEAGTETGTEFEIVGGVRLEVAERPETAERPEWAEQSESAEPDCVNLSRFGVHEHWKGEGVGSRLLDYIETEIRELGYDAVWLTTPGEHPFLPDFYRRRGYEETGPYPLDYREYDEIVLEKYLR